MQFEPLFYEEKLTVINSFGDVAIVTLWNMVQAAMTVFQKAEIDLSPETSRIAVIANLYGNGLPHMLRNLLWNPQIRHIVILGQNLSGSREHLINFFEQGLEEVEFLGSPAFQIRGTTRKIDGDIRPDMFPCAPKFTVLGKLGDSETEVDLKNFFSGLLPRKSCMMPRIEPPPIPEPTVTRFPSDPRSHCFTRATPMEAWSHLIFRLYRFGHCNRMVKSTGAEIRIELQNVHVTVDNPMEETEESLARYGFSLEHFRDYQSRILDSVKPDDLRYSYGNRLRGYFRHDDELVDSLEIAARRLKKDGDSRHAYIALWDNSRDLPTGKGCPCFVSAFFRKFEGKLTLAATFRVHNAMDGWPENLYGLMAIQKFVAERANMEVGPITVISHSISIDPSVLEKARKIADDHKTDDIVDLVTGKHELRLDPNGEFTITSDSSTSEIIVEHSFNGMKIGEYRGKTAVEIEQQLARDCAVSLVGHAMYLGRMIALEEAKLRAKRSSEN